MSSFLVDSSYGKARVRLTKVTRTTECHELKELSVNIQLQGDFDRSYTDGDNSNIVPTDTMKNTVYAIAAQHPVNNIESFAKALGEHFLKRPQVAVASIEIAEDRWERITTKGKPHNHAFTGGFKDKRVTHVDCLRGDTTVESGIEELVVLKTTGSEFCGFQRDEYTTLVDLNERIFSTALQAHWLYKSADVDFDKNHHLLRQLILDVFAEHHSLAVQQTIWEMGQRALAACPDIEEIRISIPNQHRILFDVARFGLKNQNEIFVPTDEPFGLISATMSRQGAARS